jgi:hypothetical protein
MLAKVSGLATHTLLRTESISKSYQVSGAQALMLTVIFGIVLDELICVPILDNIDSLKQLSTHLLVLRRVRCNDLKLFAINTTVTSCSSDRCFHDPQATQQPPLRVIMSVLGHSKTHLTTPDM